MAARLDDNTADLQLVERAKAGDSKAFDLLVVKYQSKVMSVISRYLSRVDDIPDVAQEAFIKAYRALDKFRGDSAFYTWLYRIAINTAKNHMVTQSRRPSSDYDIDDPESIDKDSLMRDNADPVAEIAVDQLETAIKVALKALPEELRVAITLREFEGLAYDDIAAVMDCPVGTVRSRIFRAREQIDRAIEDLI